MSFDTPEAYESWLNEQLGGTGLLATVEPAYKTGPWWAAVCGAWLVSIRSADREYHEAVLPSYLGEHASDWVKDWVHIFEIAA